MINQINIVRLKALGLGSLLAVAIAGVATPVNAAPAAPKASSTESGALPSAGSKVGKQGPRVNRYCMKIEQTGSRVQETVCKTKEDWARAGVDVEAR